MTKTPDLLPCPFCGNDDPLDDGMPEASLGVCCGETGCPIDGVVFTRRDWNTRTPNKSAEVDLDDLRVPMPDHDHAFSMPCGQCLKARIINDHIDSLAASGHIATGKGGDELEEDTKKVIHLLDNGWKPVFNPPYEDTKYTLNKLPEGIISSAGFEKLSFEDAVTVQRCLEKLSTPQPAAPTQIDAGVK